MEKEIRLFTIGFTRKTAEQFFSALTAAGVQRVIDIRLNNVSQLAGFAKKDDLRYFLKAICGIDYLHRLDLAPTQEILDAYRKQKGDWAVYEQRFRRLMEERKPEKHLPFELLDRACLLCSEDLAEHCHRRLVAEYLQEHWPGVKVTHF